MAERIAVHPAGRAPSPSTGYEAPQPAHRLRRIGAAALAAGTFVGLGAMLGPVGVANANGSCSDAESYFTAGEHTVSANVVGTDCDITISGAVTLILDADLTITGEDEEPGLTIDGSGSLTVTGTGTLTVTGGAGDDGDDGADGAGDDAGHDGGDVGVGISNAGTVIIDDTATVTAIGGTGGAGGTGGDSEGGNGGAGGNGGVGGKGFSNFGAVIVGGTLTATGGDGGDGGEAGQGNGENPASPGNGGKGGTGFDNQGAFITTGHGSLAPAGGRGGSEGGGQGSMRAGFDTSALYDANLPDGCTAKGYYNIAWPSLGGRTVDDGLAMCTPPRWNALLQRTQPSRTAP